MHCNAEGLNNCTHAGRTPAKQGSCYPNRLGGGWQTAALNGVTHRFEEQVPNLGYPAADNNHVWIEKIYQAGYCYAQVTARPGQYLL